GLVERDRVFLMLCELGKSRALVQDKSFLALKELFLEGSVYQGPDQPVHGCAKLVQFEGNSGLLFLTCGMFVPFVLVHHVLEHLLIGARQYDLRQEARDLGVHFTLANTDARTGLSMASVVDVLIAFEFSSQQSSAGTSQVAAIFKLM